ncbi:predicted protein [Postia placenta Mad-698-R]|nr:predicted protein [Postia placenta Mad-698-R]
MPRRRSGKPKAGQSKHRGVDRKEGKIKRWNKASDVPLDEEDQFHASRDKILLEGDDYGNDGENDGDEDEVFALKGIPGSSDEEDGGDGGDGPEDDEDLERIVEAKGKKKSKSRKGKETSPSPSPSADESEEEEEGWGKSKAAYYSSNAAQLDSDDEEANELEVQEAMRLQAKARDALVDDDFGLADPVDVTAEPEDVLTDLPAPAVQPLPQDKPSLLRHLEKTSPESLALARDWDDIARQLLQTQVKLIHMEAEQPDALSLGMAHLHYQALFTYATTLAFYLHLRAQEKYVQHPELLRSHPVLPRLLVLKRSLATLEDLDFDLSDDDGGGDDSSSDENASVEGANGLWSPAKRKGLEFGELEDLLQEANAVIVSQGAEDPDTRSPKRRVKPAVPEEPPKKKRKTGKSSADAKPATPVFDLVEPDLAQPKAASSSAGRPASSAATDVYGEATALPAADAADKMARKKSLRFHAARIESTAARRQHARSAAMGGDDDIPYRERKKEKEQRAAREAAKRRGAGGDDLDDAEPEARKPEKKRAREDDEGSGSEAGGDGDGYYELVQRHSKEKREQKKAGQAGQRRMATGGRARTALHGLDEERDDDVVRARDAVHLEVLREVARAVDERLGEQALVRVARAVRDEQRVLGELGAPRDDGCDEPALPWGHAPRVCAEEEAALEARAELRGVEQREAGVHDLKIDVNEVECDAAGGRQSECCQCMRREGATQLDAEGLVAEFGGDVAPVGVRAAHARREGSVVALHGAAYIAQWVRARVVSGANANWLDLGVGGENR